MAALFAPGCGDPGSNSGGAAGHGTGASTGTTSTSTAGNTGSGAGGGSSGGTTGGTTSSGGNSTGGNNTGGTTSTGGNNTGGANTGGNNTGGNNTGGNNTGGNNTGGNNTGGNGMAGSGMGGVAGSGGVTGGAGGGTGTVVQPDGWGAPPLVMMPPLPPKPDLTGYPVDADGNPILVPGATFNMVAVTTPDAMTARDACAALVSNCYSPGVRSMDACMMSAPPCLTTTPWLEATACCAQACMDGYAALRTAKVDPVTSYLKVLYDGPICMPGVDTMLMGGVP